MSDTGPGNSNVRPMRAADYSRGRPVQPAPDPTPAQPPPTAQDPQAPAAPAGAANRRAAGYFPPNHPLRELLVGSVIGAAVLWAVPKVLENISARVRWPGGDDEFGFDEFDDGEDFEP